MDRGCEEGWFFRYTKYKVCLKNNSVFVKPLSTKKWLSRNDIEHMLQAREEINLTNKKNYYKKKIRSKSSESVCKSLEDIGKPSIG